jgi:RHS repeat-associated protein
MFDRNHIQLSYRYGFQSQEKEDEIVQGLTSAEYWMYDSRIGRRWNVDPVIKHHESPYATFANNPNLFVDPNGADTLLIHRKFLYEKKGVNVYKVTFSLIVNDVEKVVGGVMYMGVNSKAVQLPTNSNIKLNPKQQYGEGIKYLPEETIHVLHAYTKEDGTIGMAIFFHPNNTPIGNTGCITLSEKEPYVNSFGVLYFDATGPAVEKVNDLYQTADADAGNGGLLTGDEFLLKTNSEAPEDNNVFPQLPEPLTSADNADKTKQEVLRDSAIQTKK